MDQLFIEFAKQAPALAVLAWIVWKFLASQESRDNKLGDIANSCHNFQAASTKTVSEVLDRNTTALNANTHMLGRVESVLDDLDTKISRE